MHWAAKYIGLRWSPEHNCWWLVREIFRDRHGIDMPELGIGELQVADNVAVIKQAASTSGWRRINDKPREDDVLLCRDVIGKRHVGWIVEAQGRIKLLHNDGHLTTRGPVGSVVAQVLDEAIADGLTEIEIWRRA